MYVTDVPLRNYTLTQCYEIQQIILQLVTTFIPEISALI